MHFVTRFPYKFPQIWSQRCALNLVTHKPFAERMTHISQRLTLTALRSARLSGEPCGKTFCSIFAFSEFCNPRKIVFFIFLSSKFCNPWNSRSKPRFQTNIEKTFCSCSYPVNFVILGTHVQNRYFGQILQRPPLPPDVIHGADDYDVFEFVIVKVRSPEGHHQVSQS